MKRHRCSGRTDWPTPAELVAAGTRVVIAGNEPSRLVFSTDSEAIEVCMCAWAAWFIHNVCANSLVDNKYPPRRRVDQ